MTPEDELQLQDSARRVLDELHPVARARLALPWADPRQRDLWAELAALGWFGLRVPEPDGGLGLGLSAVCVLAEEAGRRLLNLPLATSIVLAPWLDRQTLDGLLAGVVCVAATPPDAQWHVYAGQCTHRAFPGRVAGADAARSADGSGGFGPGVALVVEPDADGVPGLDPTIRLRACAPAGCDAVSETIPADGDRNALAADAGDAWLQWRLVLCAEALGSAGAALDLAVQWARERQQFGRAIGANQGLKHPLADAWMALDGARLAVRHAASTFDAQPGDRAHDVAAAVLATLQAAPRVAQLAIQVHGAIGFTWEHDVHLYLKRIRMIGSMLGGSERAWAGWQRHARRACAG